MKGTGIFDWIRLPKWVVLIFSFIATALLPALFFPALSGFCSGYEPNCIIPYSTLSLYFFWAPVSLLLSIATLPFSRKVFDSWIKFLVPWILFSILVIFVTPGNDGNNMEVNWKAIVSLSLAAISFTVSFFIILVKSIQVYWFKK